MVSVAIISALDGHADERAPLGPRTVVVANVRIAEQLVQREPRVRRPLADPAVRDYLAFRRYALALVQRFQICDRQERAGLRVDGSRPGDVLRPRDVTGLLRLLLRKVRWREQLAAVFLGRPDVDQSEPRGADNIVLH